MADQTLFVGGGNMGRAILKGYLTEGGDPSVISIVDPFSAEAIAVELPGCRVYEQIADIPDQQKFDSVVLATKPQLFDDASSGIASILSANGLVISIMAGVSSERIASVIGGNPTIVRCMPNMAAAVGRSVNVAFTTNIVHRQRFENLFSGSGPVSWIDNEEDIHITTAISGSGPAYFFAFVESLAKAGSDCGLGADFALALAIDTQIGAAELLKNRREPARLRESVTSKGGTTAAGLGEFFAEGKLDAIVKNAVSAAVERSKSF